MAELVYAAFTSLDGYVADETGNFDWAELDEEVHAFIIGSKRHDRTAAKDPMEPMRPIVRAVLSPRRLAHLAG